MVDFDGDLVVSAKRQILWLFLRGDHVRPDMSLSLLMCRGCEVSLRKAKLSWLCVVDVFVLERLPKIGVRWDVVQVGTRIEVVLM